MQTIRHWSAIGIMCVSAQSHLRTISAQPAGFCALVRRTAQNSAASRYVRKAILPAERIGSPPEGHLGFRRSPYGQHQTSYFGAFWRAFSPYPKTWMHKRPQCPALCWPSKPLGQRVRAGALRAHASNHLVAAQRSKAPCAVPYAAAPVNILKPLISLA